MTEREMMDEIAFLRKVNDNLRESRADFFHRMEQAEADARRWKCAISFMTAEARSEVERLEPYLLPERPQ